MGIKTKFMKSYSLRGEWTEARFMIRACEHGFNVSRPWGGSSRYDFAVELNGQFLRVQVKSTTWKKDGVAYVFALCGATRRRYTEEEIDFFAVYVIPEDAWYIIPASVVVRLKSSLRLYPHSTNQRKHKYECYFEAWHLLKSAKPKAKSATSSGH
jgi:PD-(D/E)XK endonuclease